MARKVYLTTHGCLSYGRRLQLKDGTVEQVEFKGGTREPAFVAATYVTDNVEVQKELETCKHFNREYKLLVLKDVAPLRNTEAADKTPDLKKIGNIKNIQTAITHLAAKGVDVSDIGTFDEVVAAAAKAGIEFTKLVAPE